MTPGRYIWIGVVSGIVGFAMLVMANANDSATASVNYALGEPARDSTGVVDLLGVVLLIAAVVLVLIGVVGAGVKAGRKD